MILGLLLVLLTPFVFFPEIMGDVGVTRASSARNALAVVCILVGSLTALGGLVVLTRRLFHRDRPPA